MHKNYDWIEFWCDWIEAIFTPSKTPTETPKPCQNKPQQQEETPVEHP